MRQVFQKASRSTSRGERPRGRHTLAALALIVGAALAVGGCTSFKSGKRGGETNVEIAEMTPADWPIRDTARVEGFRDATPKVYRRLDLAGSKSLDELSPRHARLVSEPMFEVTYNDIVGQGLLRVISFKDGDDPQRFTSEQDQRQGFRPNAWFLSSMTLNDPRRAGYLSRTRMKRAADEASNPLSGVQYSNVDLDTAIREGIPMGFPPVQRKAPKGLIIHFVAMMGNEYETKVIRQMRDEGWAIVHIDSNPRVVGGGRTYDIRNDEELDIAAASVANRIDDVLAEHAYAAEAALEYCRKNRPDLPTDRVVMMGFSAGSLVVPTAAARLGDDVESAVLIAGGANLLEIAMDSALSNGGLQFNWGPGRGGERDKQKLLRAYLKHSRLDPYRTATLLSNKPVLQYWGKYDKWVPANSGRVLSERLNSPDKVTVAGGHCVLFLLLPGQSDRISQWVSQSVSNAETRTARGGVAPTSANARVAPRPAGS